MKQMLYDDHELYKELHVLLKTILDNIASICPFCENDVRPKHDCQNCDNNHMSRKCYRDGKHTDNCLLVKHLALIDIDQEDKKTKISEGGK
jgi:hypothetical protein